MIGGLVLVCAGLPFELSAGLALGGLTFTNVELLLLAMLGLWAAQLISERRLPQLSRRLLLPAAALLLIFLLSAALAPAWRLAALKFTARQLQGLLLALCLADQLRVYGWALARRLGLALAAGAALSAALGLLELTESTAVLALLANFKEQPTMAGGLLRLSATFSYANTAAMYYEALLPIVLVAVGLARDRRLQIALAGAALLLHSAALLTYSRAALVSETAALAIILLGALLYWRMYQNREPRAENREPRTENQLSRIGSRFLIQRFACSIRISLTPPLRRHPSPVRERGVGGEGNSERTYDSLCLALDSLSGVVRVIVLCAALLMFTASLLLFSLTFRVRVVEPDVDSWYRAEYAAAALPQLAPNAVVETPITLTNHGPVAWRMTGLRPVVLAYHWLDARTHLVVRYNGRRTALPQSVEPGASLAMNAVVQAPDKPGDYLLVWDLVVEHSSWFSERGSAVSQIPVAVAGAPASSQPAPAAEPIGLPQRIAAIPPPPARRELWGVALRLWRTRPLLGIGPDVFRHVYGPELGLSRWDDRIHTNNLYLELLVGAGLAGLAAFLALVGATLLPAARMLLSGVGTRQPRLWWVGLACATGLITFLIHGTLDMFLEYSATYLLLWALIGALSSVTAHASAGD